VSVFFDNFVKGVAQFCSILLTNKSSLLGFIQRLLKTWLRKVMNLLQFDIISLYYNHVKIYHTIAIYS
jgi:hypothetical protein